MLSTDKKSKKLHTVQALRGIAALLVLIFHIADIQIKSLSPSQTLELQRLTGFWNQGYAGVDMFFVISGFIIVYVTQTTRSNLTDIAHFLYSRASRIYPLWWVFAGVMMIYYWVSYGAPAAPDIANGAQVKPYIFKSIFLLPQADLPVLGVGWTLVFEMWFYLVFAGLLLFPRKYLPLTFGIWALIILVANMTAWSIPMSYGVKNVLLSPLTFEFLFGGIAALFITRKIIVRPLLFLIFGVIGFASSSVIGLSSEFNFEWQRVLAFGFPSMLIIYGMVGIELTRNFKPSDPFIKLGDWSYSLYLSHFIILLAWRQLWQALTPVLPDGLMLGGPGPWDNLIFAFCGFIGAIMVAGISYRFIEKPVLIRSRKLWTLRS